MVQISKTERWWAFHTQDNEMRLDSDAKREVFNHRCVEAAGETYR